MPSPLTTPALVLAVCLAAAAGCHRAGPPLRTTRLARRFTIVTPSEESMPGPLDVTAEEPFTAGFFADLDDDGVDELVLVGPSGARAYDYYDADQRFVHRGDLPLARGVVSAVDLDDDGQADFLVDPDGTLSVGWDDGLASEPERLGPAWRDLSCVDVDRDGWTDLVAGGDGPNSHGRPLAVFLRSGPREFEPLAAGAFTGDDRGLGLLVAGALPLPGRRPLLVQLGSTTDALHPEAAFFRSTGDGPGGQPVYVSDDPLPKDAIFRTGLFGASSVNAEAPMGLAEGDLDNDGVFDLYVSLDPYHELVRGLPGGGYEERSAGTGIMEVPGDKNPMKPWGAALVDVDLDGRADLVVAHGDDHGSHTDPGLAIGPQTFGVFINEGGFTFADASDSTGVPKSQYRSLAAADFDCDGDADFVVGGYGAWPVVVRNELDQVAHGLSLRLKGTSSGIVPAGAVVDVAPAGGGPVQHLVVGGSLSTSIWQEPWVFAGLGQATSADVTIHWPSGYVQQLPGVAGSECHVVTEPELFTVRPVQRRAPAGGVIHVFVTPRTPDGTFDPSAKVEVSATGGAVVSVAPTDASGADATITGPSAAGTSRVTITIDGTPLEVKPRLVWTAP